MKSILFIGCDTVYKLFTDITWMIREKLIQSWLIRFFSSYQLGFLWYTNRFVHCFPYRYKTIIYALDLYQILVIQVSRTVGQQSPSGSGSSTSCHSSSTSYRPSDRTYSTLVTHRRCDCWSPVICEFSGDAFDRQVVRFSSIEAVVHLDE